MPSQHLMEIAAKILKNKREQEQKPLPVAEPPKKPWVQVDHNGNPYKHCGAPELMELEEREWEELRQRLTPKEYAAEVAREHKERCEALGYNPFRK